MMMMIYRMHKHGRRTLARGNTWIEQNKRRKDAIRVVVSMNQPKRHWDQAWSSSGGLARGCQEGERRGP